MADEIQGYQKTRSHKGEHLKQMVPSKHKLLLYSDTFHEFLLELRVALHYYGVSKQILLILRQKAQNICTNLDP